jgi:L-alanine-DL-glutamate epimerase-like enolase superfamily enzyme
MIKTGRASGMKIMMGSMNESSIGSAAIAHFLPQLDFVDVDGPLLLDEDIATGLHFDYGKVTVSEKAGLGIDVI